MLQNDSIEFKVDINNFSGPLDVLLGRPWTSYWDGRKSFHLACP